MSIAEIIPEALALSRGEKFQLARMLLDNLANDRALNRHALTVAERD